MTREEAITELNTFKIVAKSELGENALDMAIEALKQEPFINKPCVAHQVCHEDKVKVPDMIRAEIEQIEINGHIRDAECFCAGINAALNVINKYRAESEG